MASETAKPGKAAKPDETRTLEEGVQYSLGHRTRIEVQALLNEGPRSASELAKLTGQPLSRLGHHINEMVDSGRIEVAYVKKVRNVDQHFYRALEVPFISDEEARALPFEARQEIAATILQGLGAEALAALWAGKLSIDPVCMSWRWYLLDAQAQWEAHEEQAAFLARIKDIEAKSVNRVAESGEATTSTIVTVLGFERFRPVGETGPASSIFRSPPQGKAE